VRVEEGLPPVLASAAAFVKQWAQEVVHVLCGRVICMQRDQDRSALAEKVRELGERSSTDREVLGRPRQVPGGTRRNLEDPVGTRFGKTAEGGI
jgi:hypothetical protein